MDRTLTAKDLSVGDILYFKEFKYYAIVHEIRGRSVDISYGYPSLERAKKQYRKFKEGQIHPNFNLSRFGSWGLAKVYGKMDSENKSKTKKAILKPKDFWEV